jgi:hypothetical protein
MMTFVLNIENDRYSVQYEELLQWHLGNDGRSQWTILVLQYNATHDIARSKEITLSMVVVSSFTTNTVTLPMLLMAEKKDICTNTPRSFLTHASNLGKVRWHGEDFFARPGNLIKPLLMGPFR